MKKLVSLLASLAILCSANIMPVSAMEAVTIKDYNTQHQLEAFPEIEEKCIQVEADDFVFEVGSEFAVLTDYKNTEAEEVVIPSEVYGVPVTQVKGAPFGFCRNLKTITLPDTLQYFHWYELVCTTVEQVTSSNTASSSIIGSANTQIIELNSNKNAEDDMLIPSVTKVIVSESNPYYTVSDGIVYSKDMKTVIGCPPALDMEKLKISEKAERINDFAFFECFNLKETVIPSNITHINNSAFWGCYNLESAVIPETIKDLSGDMFFWCKSLKKIEFKGEIERIGYGVFNECESLKDFVVPETVIYIGSNAFENAGCIEIDNGIHYVQNWVVGSDEDIERIAIREGTEGIASMAFVIRNNVKEIVIPSCVKFFGEAAILSSGLEGVSSVVHYYAHTMGESVISGAKNATDIYIYDAECEIFDGEKTIPAMNKIYQDELSEEESILSFAQINKKGTVNYKSDDIVIHGYEGSTAQAYAEKYNRKFEIIEDKSISGDIDGDGDIRMTDAVLMQKWIMSGETSNITNWESADLNKDGVIDVFDFCLLRNEILKIK